MRWAIPTPGGGTVLEDNIFAHDAPAQLPGHQAEHGQRADAICRSAVGLNDLTVRDNIVYDWYQGLSTDTAYVPAGLGLQGDQRPDDRPATIFRTRSPAACCCTATPTTARPNRSATTTTGTTRPRRAGSPSAPRRRALTIGRTPLEPDANRTRRKYRDPGRTVGTYNRSLGGTATNDAFLAEVRNRHGRTGGRRLPPPASTTTSATGSPSTRRCRRRASRPTTSTASAAAARHSSSTTRTTTASTRARSTHLMSE